MAYGHFAGDAFEQKHLVSQIERVTVVQIDFHLRRAHFMNQGVQRNALDFAPVVHDVEDFIVIVHRIDAETLTTGFGALGAAHRRSQWQIFIGLHLHQVKFQLRRNNRFQAQIIIGLQHALQHIARGNLYRLAIETIGIVNDGSGRVFGPRHEAQTGGVGQQAHVAVGHGGKFFLRIITGHRLGEHGFGHAYAFGGIVFVSGDDFTAGGAAHVGHQTFDFGDVVGV